MSKDASRCLPDEAFTATQATPGTRLWRIAKRLIIVSLIAIGLWILLAPLWLPRIGTFLVVSDPLQRADAIVILAGDEDERLAHGAWLFEQGYADWFVVTNMRIELTNPERTYAFLVTRKAIQLGIPEDRILVVREVVETTYEEAVAIRAFAMKHDLRSIIVVTSTYHTRRARWIINQVFEERDTTIVVRPAEDNSYQAERWWRSKQGWWITGSEYAKLLAHLLGCKHADC